MKVGVLPEPALEFRAGNRHIDPRYGITFFGPADGDAQSAPREIVAGIVGATSAVEGLRRWLDRCRDPIEGKTAKPGQENLFPAFPGFSADVRFRSELVFDESLVREIADRDLRPLATSGVRGAVADAAGLYFEAARSLAETNRCHVILIARPDELHDLADPPVPPEAGDPDSDEETAEDVGEDFHDLLKARALTLSCPLQLIRRETWDPDARRTAERSRPLQDEATRAWNLHAALYYKAGGTPWRIPRASTDLTTCYIGVSFYRTPDDNELHTAVAQVFNERGDGVVVRGGSARISKTDRQVHLDATDSRQLLLDALEEYRRVHGNLPARVALHKTSSFDEAEREGFAEAADQEKVAHLELIWIQRRAAPRLFRTGQLPPLRGTTLQLDPMTMVVYTRGSIEFFHTYPGMYVPRPLLVRPVLPTTDLLGTASDILALSKMNWNNAQLDERDPLTLRTASRVGSILKHVEADKPIATRYGYYM
jgi:hypothetical protein